MNSPYQIITECALFFNVSTEDIISSSRKGYSVTDARAVACYIINRKMGNHGRGRLMVRELCDGIERNRYGSLNETVYRVKLGESQEGK